MNNPSKENIQKAYDEACEDGKKAIKTLWPDEFDDEFKFDDNKIYPFKDYEIFILKNITVVDDDNKYMWMGTNRTYSYYQEKFENAGGVIGIFNA